MKILETKDDSLIRIFTNRLADTNSLWETVKKTYKQNKNVWSNKPDWLQTVPKKRSKVRDNRIFLATESQINKVTARPIKPFITPANGTPEAQEIAESLQTVFLEAYKERNVKKNLKRGLRFLQFSRLMCLKIFWNHEIDDFDLKVADSRKVRFSKNSTCEKESEIAIEIIDDKTILQLIETFPDKKADILDKQGITEETAREQNMGVEYYEFWIGDGVCWVFKNMILKKQRNPFYDFDGLLLTPDEMAEIHETEQTKTGGETAPRLNGRRRRQMFSKFKNEQEGRSADDGQYSSYLYNHFNKPRKPYIFGTVLEVEDCPIGETSLIEMVIPLQEGVDKRKRQIADNADMMNGITKVDTDICTMTLADARAIHYDPEGLVFGPGVGSGVTRETGQSLPAMVFEDMQDSRGEIDEIFGTTGTFRGSGGDSEKTATGRAILREEGYSRLDEIMDLVDYFGREIYNWWFQMIKVKYTESHLIKIIGADKAIRTLDLMQDDLQDGIEIKIVPGQSLPEDKMFRSEKAREDMEAGVIDMVTYLKETGGYDNPEEVAKRSIMFKTNPFSIIEMDEEDIQKIVKAQELLAQLNPMETPTPDGKPIAEARQRIEQLVGSPEFKNMPPEEQQKSLQKIKQQFKKVGGAIKS